MSKKCSYLNCNIFPCFNKLGETKGLYYKEHAKDGMIDIKNKTCIEKGCTTIPSFGTPGNRLSLKALFLFIYSFFHWVQTITLKLNTSVYFLNNKLKN